MSGTLRYSNDCVCCGPGIVLSPCPPATPNAYTLVARIEPGEQRCPACGGKLQPHAIDRRRCWDCLTFLVLPGETVDDLIALRQNKPDMPTYSLRWDKAFLPIHLWDGATTTAIFTPYKPIKPL